MKVGSIVFATEQGLGYLAHDFYKHGMLTEVAIIRHGRRESHLDWYPPETIQISSKPFLNDEVKDLIKRMDVMLFFETPFDWDIFSFCKEVGTPSVLMPMHECMPVDFPQQPDRFLCPSYLDFDVYGGVHLPIPVEVEWEQRNKARVFVHNAGHGGLIGRNGTKELLSSLQYVETPLKLILRSQDELKYDNVVVPHNVELDVRIGTVPREELYSLGDVFVFPEKFNGLSLPLQEARAAGMLVMASNRYPMNQWLPLGPLIPIHNTRNNRVSPRCRVFTEAVIDPKRLASTIDHWNGCEIRDYSLSGKEWAKTMSWEALKPKYLKVLAP